MTLLITSRSSSSECVISSLLRYSSNLAYSDKASSLAISAEIVPALARILSSLSVRKASSLVFQSLSDKVAFDIAYHRKQLLRIP